MCVSLSVICYLLSGLYVAAKPASAWANAGSLFQPANQPNRRLNPNLRGQLRTGFHHFDKLLPTFDRLAWR
jgi:hypothetical protein